MPDALHSCHPLPPHHGEVHKRIPAIPQRSSAPVVLQKEPSSDESHRGRGEQEPVPCSSRLESGDYISQAKGDCHCSGGVSVLMMLRGLELGGVPDYMSLFSRKIIETDIGWGDEYRGAEQSQGNRLESDEDGG